MHEFELRSGRSGVCTGTTARDEAPRFLIRDRDRAYALPSPVEYQQWESAVDRLRRAHHGRTVTLTGSSNRFVENVSIT